MSVLARKRSKSKYEFYTNAIRLRSEVTKLLLRDLGVKTKEVGTFYRKRGHEYQRFR